MNRQGRPFAFMHANASAEEAHEVQLLLLSEATSLLKDAVRQAVTPLDRLERNVCPNYRVRDSRQHMNCVRASPCDYRRQPRRRECAFRYVAGSRSLGRLGQQGHERIYPWAGTGPARLLEYTDIRNHSPWESFPGIRRGVEALDVEARSQPVHAGLPCKLERSPERGYPVRDSIMHGDAHEHGGEAGRHGTR